MDSMHQMGAFCERKRRILCGLVNEAPVQSCLDEVGAGTPSSRYCNALPVSDLTTSLNQNCSKRDRSLKGLVDVGMVPICDFLNNHHNFVTTSCCSGRITCYQRAATVAGSRLKNKGKLIFVSHGYVEPQRAGEILDLVKRGHRHYPEKQGAVHGPQNGGQKHAGVFCEGGRSTVAKIAASCEVQPAGAKSPMIATGGNTHPFDSLLISTDLKFEPLILHVECRDTASAMLLLSAALAAGLKQSGISSLGKRNVVAIRGSQRLEVPLTHPVFSGAGKRCISFDKPVFNGEGAVPRGAAEVAVDEPFMQLLLTSCNERLKVNEMQIRRLETLLKRHLSSGYPGVKFRASGSLLPQGGSFCSRCLNVLRRLPEECEVKLAAPSAAVYPAVLDGERRNSKFSASDSPAYVGVSIRTQVEAVRGLLQAANLLDTTRHIAVITEPHSLLDVIGREGWFEQGTQSADSGLLKDKGQVSEIEWLALLPVKGCFENRILSQAPKALLDSPGILKNTRKSS